MALISEALKLDIENIKKGIGSDPRIGSAFLDSGCGYGGSCLPKDINALITMAKQVNLNCAILQAVEQRNIHQKHLLAEKLLAYFGDDLHDKKIALLGLAFKPKTDDLREASSSVFLTDILKYSVKVFAYDPLAIPNARKAFPTHWVSSGKLHFTEDLSSALRDADALVIVTEWDEFKEIDLKHLKQLMRGNFILDGRNIFSLEKPRDLGFDYQGIGRTYSVDLLHNCH